MNKFIVEKNEYLKEDIEAYYSLDYVGYKKPNNPDFINHLKNTYNTEIVSVLQNAVNNTMAVLKDVLEEFMDLYLCYYGLSSAVVCVVPRAKVNYHPDQLVFKSCVEHAIKKVNKKYSQEFEYINGINYVARTVNTKTTHLPRDIKNYDNSGSSPYPGITKDTCKISNLVKNSNILLIDDIYTKSINVDEDVIQALLDNGAEEVRFYAVAKTLQKNRAIEFIDFF